jgi:hypothetical protein
MTWLGKILAVLVMVMAVAGMWFITSAYVARTNWKTQADIYKKAYEDAKLARDSEYRLYQSQQDALSRQLNSEQANVASLTKRLADADAVKDENVKKMAQLDATIKESDIKAVELQASLQATLSEAQELRRRNNDLENKSVQLVRERQDSERGRLEAEIQARQAVAARRIVEQKADDLQAQLTDLKTSGGSGSASVQNRLNKPPPPIPDGLRGSVTAVASSGIAAVSVGLDAGLAVGSVVDVFREDAGKYLGTITIQEVHAKNAVGTFKPSDPRRTLKQLRPEELPKVGDTIGKVGPTLVGAAR